MTDTLMHPPVIVVTNIVYTFFHFRSVLKRMKIDVFILYGPPKTFDPNIIFATTTSIHTDWDSVFLQSLLPLFTSILTALFWIKHLWSPMLSYGPLQHFYCVGLLKCVVKTPCNYVSAVHVDDGIQVKKAFRHRDIAYVGAPHLVGFADFQFPKKIRMNIWCRPQNAQLWTWIWGVYVHHVH